MTQTAAQTQTANPHNHLAVVYDGFVYVGLERGNYALTHSPYKLDDHRAKVIFEMGRLVNFRLVLTMSEQLNAYLDQAELHEYLDAYEPSHVQGSAPKRRALAASRERLETLQAQLSAYAEIATEIDFEHNPQD